MNYDEARGLGVTEWLRLYDDWMKRLQKAASQLAAAQMQRQATSERCRALRVQLRDSRAEVERLKQAMAHSRHEAGLTVGTAGTDGWR